MPSLLLANSTNDVTLTYGAMSFNDSVKVLHYSRKPRKSASGRNSTVSDFSLTVSFYASYSSRSTTDFTMAQLEETLAKEGQVLTLSGRGVGAHAVNLPGGRKDCEFGPWPSIDNIENVGSGLTVKVTWSVTWATVTCSDGVTESLYPLELVWDCALKYDRGGFETRSITGWLTIPNNRTGPREQRMRNTADQLRERVLPLLPWGYERTVREWKNDYNKSKLTFNVEDKQFAGAVYPPGTVQAEASRSMRQTPGKPLEWTGQFNMEMLIAPGAPVGDAIYAFFLMLEDFWSGWRPKSTGTTSTSTVWNVSMTGGPPAGVRAGGTSGGVTWGGTAGGGVLGGVVGGATGGIWGGGTGGVISSVGAASAAGAAATAPVLRPWAFEFSDPVIYGGLMKVSCGCTFKVFGAGLRMVLERSGLWRAPPAAINNFLAWAQSVPTHFNSRGVSGPVLGPDDDLIQDLCHPTPADAILRNQKDSPTQVVELRGDRLPRYLESGFKTLFPEPTATDSWMDYRNSPHVEVDSAVAVGRVLPSTTLVDLRSNLTKGFNPATGVLPAAQNPRGGYYPEVADLSLVTSGAGGGGRLDAQPPASPAGGTFTQQMASPTTYVTMTGYGVRCGFRVPRPNITEYDGAPVRECSRVDCGEGFEEQIVGADALGRPIYIAKWKLRYVITDAETKRPNGFGQVLPNPVYSPPSEGITF